MTRRDRFIDALVVPAFAVVVLTILFVDHFVLRRRGRR